MVFALQAKKELTMTREDQSLHSEGTPTISVNVVELGSSIDRVGDPGGGVGGAADNVNTLDGTSSKHRGRRKKSPMARLLEGSSGHQQQPSSSSSRPEDPRRRRRSRSGERIYQAYQGRINRKSQQQRQQQQQEQQQETPDQQPQQQPQQPRKQWSEIKNEIRRRSRDGVTELRRRSRDGAEQIRRRLSMDARESGLVGSQINKNKHHRRASMERRDSQERGLGNDSSHHGRGGMDISEMSELERLRERFRRKRQQQQQQQQNQNQKQDSATMGSHKKMERRMSKSMGHALKDGSMHGMDVDVAQSERRRLSQSMLDNTSDHTHDSDDDSKEQARKKDDEYNKRRAESMLKQHRRASLDSSPRDLGVKLREEDPTRRQSPRQATKKSSDMKDRRNMMQNRRGSLDSSMMHVMQTKASGNDNEPTTSLRRPAQHRRINSLDKSTKLGESATGSDLAFPNREHYLNQRRRSNSCDDLNSSWRKENPNRKDGGPINARRASVDERAFSHRDRRRSYSELDEMIRKESEHLADDMLEGLFSGGQNSKAEMRKTHTGVPTDESKSEVNKIWQPKRKSESNARHRNSYDAKKIEMAKMAWKDVHTGSAAADTAGRGKNGQDHRGSIRMSDVTQPGSAENSVNSKGSNKVGEEDVSRSKNKNRKSRCSFQIGPLHLCTMCLCYCLSIILFSGFGFWLNMYFFKDDENGSGTSTTTTAPGNGGEMIDTKDDINGSGMILSTPSFNASQPTLNTTNEGMVTKFSPSSLGPSYLPSIPPTSNPSVMPSSAMPSNAPTYYPTSQPSLSSRPTASPSDLPSFSPTSIPECPEQLFKSVSLGNDGILTLKYDVVVYPDTLGEEFGGGLLCASLEYEGDAAWIGLAFSEASRNPQFGRKEAIIGIPGMLSAAAVSMDGSATLGQQNVALEKGPTFVNPAKYEIPAGGSKGMGKNEGYFGPSLNLLRGLDEQTLVSGSVAITDPYADGGIISNQSKRHTVLSFAKYLREPGEIHIDPFASTLLLYAVATPMDGGNIDEYNGNPEWQSTYIKLLDKSTSAVKSGVTEFVRKRKRQHIFEH